MRIMSLNEMLSELRHEARLSSDASHGIHLQERHIALLRRIQEEVFDTYDWPMLETSGTVDIAAGQRYGAYPEKLDLSGINQVFVKMDGDEDWSDPLTYGIQAEHLNDYDSDADERHEQVYRWAHYLAEEAEVVNTNMFEIWPLPSTAGKLRFEGTRKLLPLSDPDKDYSTLDGMVIVLHAAAEILAGQKAEDADLKLNKAASRQAGLRQSQSAPDNRRVSLFPQARPEHDQRFKHR